MLVLRLVCSDLLYVRRRVSNERLGVQFPNMPGNFSYATSFPAPITYAAAFDDPLVYQIGQVVGKEARAFGNNLFSG